MRVVGILIIGDRINIYITDVDKKDKWHYIGYVNYNTTPISTILARLNSVYTDAAVNRLCCINRDFSDRPEFFETLPSDFDSSNMMDETL